MEGFGVLLAAACGGLTLLVACAVFCLLADGAIEWWPDIRWPAVIGACLAVLPAAITALGALNGEAEVGRGGPGHAMLLAGALLAAPAVGATALLIGRRHGLSRWARIPIAIIGATLAAGTLLLVYLVAHVLPRWD